MNPLKSRTSRRLLLLFLAISLSSCAVTPKVNERETPSYDGNNANSGFIQFLADGSLEITASGKERYDSLIENYGKQTIPPTPKDFGCHKLGNGNWSITKEGLERWFALKQIMERERINQSESLIKKIGL